MTHLIDAQTAKEMQNVPWNIITRETRIRFMFSLWTRWRFAASSASVIRETDGTAVYFSFTYRNRSPLSPLTLFVACHWGKIRGSRPPWNFLIRQIRIRLFANASRRRTPRGFFDDASHLPRRDNGSKDHGYIYQLYCISPGTWIHLLDARDNLMEEQIEWRQCWRRACGRESGGATRNYVETAFLRLQFIRVLFSLVLSCFCARKLECRRYLLQRERDGIHGREVALEKRTRSFLSLLVLSCCRAYSNTSQYPE